MLDDVERTWKLAPAYDITHSNWAGEWTQGHQMSVNGKFNDISLDDLREMADRFEVPNIERVLFEVAAAVESWPDAARQARVDEATMARISADLDRYRPR